MANIKYRSYYAAWSKHERQHVCAGERLKQDYQPVYDTFGIWHLEPTRKSNLYLDIQSYADSCDINVLMARYRNGEVDVLRQVQGYYGDVSNIPTNYAEIVNAKLQAESLFASLSADVRAKYNNSVEQFMAELGTRSGLEKLGYKFEDSAAEPSVESDGGVKGES